MIKHDPFRPIRSVSNGHYLVACQLPASFHQDLSAWNVWGDESWQLLMWSINNVYSLICIMIHNQYIRIKISTGYILFVRLCTMLQMFNVAGVFCRSRWCIEPPNCRDFGLKIATFYLRGVQGRLSYQLMVRIDQPGRKAGI